MSNTVWHPAQPTTMLPPDLPILAKLWAALFWWRSIFNGINPRYSRVFLISNMRWPYAERSSESSVSAATTVALSDWITIGKSDRCILIDSPLRIALISASSAWIVHPCQPLSFACGVMYVFSYDITSAASLNHLCLRDWPLYCHVDPFVCVCVCVFHCYPIQFSARFSL